MATRISLGELRKGCEAFRERESRDAMYRIARRLVDESWDDPADAADGLGVILLTWNQAAYRYGRFDFGKLEDFLRRNRKTLDSFRQRSIRSFSAETGADSIEALFRDALEALVNLKNGRRTPVGVAKALHTIAPNFFPLWDQAIARKYGCYWYTYDKAASKYVRFMEISQNLIAALEEEYAQRGKADLPTAKNLASALSQLYGTPKSLLKFLDEYNYVK